MRISWREATIGVIATSVGRIDDGVDEIKVPITAYQHIVWLGIENVMQPIGVVLAIVLLAKTKTKEFIVDFLLSGQTGFVDVWLH